MSRDYTITKAPQDDAAIDEIGTFLRAESSEFLRRLREPELRALVRQGRFYVARSNRDGAIVGAIYLRSADRQHWEIGGAVIAAKHQRFGLAQCLSTVAIVHPYLQERVSHDRIGRHFMEGLVRPHNVPMRALMDRAEFSALGERKLDPARIQGIGHFPVDPDGFVAVLAFAFDEKYAVKCLKRIRSCRDGGALNAQGRTVAFNIFGLRIEEGIDPLQKLLDELDG